MTSPVYDWRGVNLRVGDAPLTWNGAKGEPRMESEYPETTPEQPEQEPSAEPAPEEEEGDEKQAG